MYLILVYDINEKRVARMLKLCRRYLHWIQNSVFEGELTEGQLVQLKYEARALMKEGDSLIIFRSENQKWLTKEILGKEKNTTDPFL